MTKNQIYGVLAEFKDPSHLLEATNNVRKEGYINFDCHTPFPVHGLDDAMGLKRSIVGYIVGIGCVGGAILGMSLQWWSSTIEYPIIISGKPFFSWQAYMIITFVLMVLGGAFSALIGMFHPLFNSEKFAKATDDGFFISIEYCDPLFDIDDTKHFLKSLGAINIEVVES